MVVEAKLRVDKMNVRVGEEKDPVCQALLEVD